MNKNRSVEDAFAGQPNPEIWPECPTCGAAYVVRRAYLLPSGQHEWIWQRDCKHGVEAVLKGKSNG